MASYYARMIINSAAQEDDHYQHFQSFQYVHPHWRKRFKSTSIKNKYTSVTFITVVNQKTSMSPAERTLYRAPAWGEGVAWDTCVHWRERERTFLGLCWEEDPLIASLVMVAHFYLSVEPGSWPLLWLAWAWVHSVDAPIYFTLLIMGLVERVTDMQGVENCEQKLFCLSCRWYDLLVK